MIVSDRLVGGTPVKRIGTALELLGIGGAIVVVALAGNGDVLARLTVARGITIQELPPCMVPQAARRIIGYLASIPGLAVHDRAACGSRDRCHAGPRRLCRSVLGLAGRNKVSEEGNHAIGAGSVAGIWRQVTVDTLHEVGVLKENVEFTAQVRGNR